MDGALGEGILTIHCITRRRPPAVPSMGGAAVLNVSGRAGYWDGAARTARLGRGERARCGGHPACQASPSWTVAAPHACRQKINGSGPDRDAALPERRRRGGGWRGRHGIGPHRIPNQARVKHLRIARTPCHRPAALWRQAWNRSALPLAAPRARRRRPHSLRPAPEIPVHVPTGRRSGAPDGAGGRQEGQCGRGRRGGVRQGSRP